MSALRQRLVEASWRGPALAMGAALLFGASTPVAKLLLARLDPWYLAAVLYLGSGMGLALARFAGRLLRPGVRGQGTLARSDWPWLGGAILFGGVLGPILLLTGLSTTGAAPASLLLNLESVFTALLAWFVFRENVDPRLALGMTAIAAGALVLSWRGGADWEAGGLSGALAITGACFAWALDNNLTRKVSLADPVQIAMLKGLVAGGVNFALALCFGAGHSFEPGLFESGALLGAAVGMLGYGLSLVLFVLALRNIGAARTGAYFAAAPFIGAILAVLAFGEPLTAQLTLAGALMLAGLWLHLTERHEHEHEHPLLAHAHRHRHDAHHQHRHGPDDPSGEPHLHRHIHIRLRHSHRHFPDAHHSHGH